MQTEKTSARRQPGAFIGYIPGGDPERVTKVAPTPFPRVHVPDTPQSTIQHQRSPRSRLPTTERQMQVMRLVGFAATAKWTVQSVLECPNGRALAVSDGRFYLPGLIYHYFTPMSND